jgi:hypothetical protein
VTVVGAVLRTREGGALRGGASQAQAFIDGYHCGLWLTIVLLAAGVVLSYLSLRPRAAVTGAEPAATMAAGREAAAPQEATAERPAPGWAADSGGREGSDGRAARTVVSPGA